MNANSSSPGVHLATLTIHRMRSGSRVVFRSDARASGPIGIVGARASASMWRCRERFRAFSGGRNRGTASV